MRTDRKKRAQELASDLQLSQAIEAAAIKELVVLQFEEAKTILVNAHGDDILRRQGEAQGLSRLLDMLTRKPIPVKEQ